MPVAVSLCCRSMNTNNRAPLRDGRRSICDKVSHTSCEAIVVAHASCRTLVGERSTQHSCFRFTS